MHILRMERGIVRKGPHAPTHHVKRLPTRSSGRPEHGEAIVVFRRHVVGHQQEPRFARGPTVLQAALLVVTAVRRVGNQDVVLWLLVLSYELVKVLVAVLHFREAKLS